MSPRAEPVAPPLARSLRDLAELLHLPPVGFVLAAAFLFVRVLGDGRTDPVRLGVYLAAVLATQLSIALHNDWCDRAADAVAKPWRLLPRGVLGPGSILFAAIALLVLGLSLAALLGPAVLLLVGSGTSAGFVYNAWLKRTAWSWIPFAFALPTLAVCSLEVAGVPGPIPLVLYLIGVPLVLAIHLADSAPDIEGDRAVGSRGLAVTLGRDRTQAVCWSGLTIAIALAMLLRPPGPPPGPLLPLSVALLLGAVLLSGRSLPAHRYLIFASAVAVAVDYVASLAA